MGEVVYGIDFRAGKEEAPMSIREAIDVIHDYRQQIGLPEVPKPDFDTAPSEYVAPDGDCA